jgi:uncharacterized protein (DUF1697 family)
MTVMISMLRGVNVGGHNKIKMEALRALYESLGLLDAQTYIQSGNVVFRTKGRDLVQLCRRIGDGIEQGFGFRPLVIVRTIAELRDTIARNPFATRPGIDPSKLLVTFLSGDPDAEARENLLKIKIGPEELRMVGRETFVHFPNGMGQTKLPAALIEKTLKTPGTGRNWNTVNKLLEMAEGLEGPR